MRVSDVSGRAEPRDGECTAGFLRGAQPVSAGTDAPGTITE